MSSEPAPSTLLDIHVVAHTHWDREWYHPAARFRQYLVALVRELINEPPDSARPFLLDGQAVILEDVLAVHPEWEQQLRAHLAAGSLEAGPWYVLADELIPSAEALVRNLLAGKRLLTRLGGTAPPVCYSPDSFGHPAALPTIAAGFGLKVGVLWRGYGGARWPSGDTVRWIAPDSSELLIWHLPPDGYEYGSSLPADKAKAAARWREIEASAVSRARTGVLLLTNGADHHARQPDVDDAIESLNEVTRAVDAAWFKRSSLTEWSRAFRAAADLQEIPVVRGELRDSYGYTWTLQGTPGARAWQKRAVAHADARLRWDVETWMSLAILNRSAHQDLALLGAAWRTFLRCLPHDTLCGCSVDAVADALESRVASVRAQAAGLRAAALDALIGRSAVAARAMPIASCAPTLVVRNRAATPRWGVVEAELLTTLGDVAVGPQSASAQPPEIELASLRRSVPKGLQVQLLSTRLAHARLESPLHYPDDDVVHVARCLVWIPPEHAVPGTGLSMWPMVGSDAEYSAAVSRVPTARPHMAPPVPATAKRDGHRCILSNGLITLTAEGDRVNMYDASRGRTINDLLHVTWQPDAGDTYTAAPRGAPERFTLSRVRVKASGPLRATLEMQAHLHVPHDYHRNSPRRRKRNLRMRRIRVRLSLSLDAGASHALVHVTAIDHAPDHRLRLIIATGLPDSLVLADAAFGPVVRTPLVLSADEQQSEHVVPTAPLHRWVARHTQFETTAIVSDGLAEYEALSDGAIAVTLLRATGELSRANLPERPGHAGWPAPTPGAQGPGRMHARFAVRMDGPIDPASIEKCANDVLLPLVAHTWRDAPPSLLTEEPAVVRGIELRGDGVIASAIKPCEDGDGVVLRAINLRADFSLATWILPWDDIDASLVRLDETALSDSSIPRISTGSGRTEIRVNMNPRAVISVRVRRRPRSDS